MNILGISCFYHDSAACLVMDGRVVAAAEEERFNRQKGSSAFPVEAINACLQSAGITIMDIDHVVFYEKPFLKFERVLSDTIRSFPFSYRNFRRVMPAWLSERLVLPLILKKQLGYEKQTLFVRHHMAHAASSFLVSPFDEAAILTVDGVGEWATASCGIGRGNRIEIHKEILYPDSLGLLYTAVTTYLGFMANHGEGKVMALADYGKPEYLSKFHEIVRVMPDGSFQLDQTYFRFISGTAMYTSKFVKTFGPPRFPGEELNTRHYDIAASLQALLEEILVKLATNLAKETDQKNLCIAGGVGLNCVANSRILAESPFERVFVQPASNDAGGALGAACYIQNCTLDQPRRYIMHDAYLGPEYSASHIQRVLKSRGAKFKEMVKDELTRYVAQRIADGAIIGWFQGRIEFGPRALGNRSILADARNPEMKNILNSRVKHRESFRPFGASILDEAVEEYFDPPESSPFMLFAPMVRDAKRSLVPSALHIDGTCRFQSVTKEENPLYYRLLKEFFRITGIPMIINTSFNDRGEPIVCSPEDAYACFEQNGIDCLVMGNYVIEKSES